MRYYHTSIRMVKSRNTNDSVPEKNLSLLKNVHNGIVTAKNKQNQNKETNKTETLKIIKISVSRMAQYIEI